MASDLTHLGIRYATEGFVAPVELLSSQEATLHRSALETAEREYGPLHYQPKVHTILRSPYQLATLPAVLDVVETLIGPDILLHNVTYIIKEPQSESFVSWHQDLTYWGFDGDEVVSMWLALSAATENSGCMRMIPGSHKRGRREHQTSDNENNVLFQGQTVQDVDDDHAVACPLQPGEASFHHGWTLHASTPNAGSDRRIGLNVQYLNPRIRQMKNDADTAMLVRGNDAYRHFGVDVPANADLEPDALARHRELQQRYRDIAGKQ